MKFGFYIYNITHLVSKLMDLESGTQTQKNLTSIQKQRNSSKTQEEFDNIVADNKDIPKVEKDRLQNNVRAKRELCFPFHETHFRLVSYLETTKEVWDRLK